MKTNNTTKTAADIIMVIPANVEISHKMKSFVTLINENSNTNIQMGKIRLQSYCDDVWAYLNYSNKRFGIDLNKKKREAYDGSMDMKDMAVAMAYRAKLDIVNERVVDRMINGLMPSTNSGKEIWDDIMIKMIDTYDDEVISYLPKLLCTDEGKEKFYKALEEKSIEIHKDGSVIFKDAKKEESKFLAPKVYDPNDPSIIDAEFKDVVEKPSTDPNKKESKKEKSSNAKKENSSNKKEDKEENSSDPVEQESPKEYPTESYNDDDNSYTKDTITFGDIVKNAVTLTKTDDAEIHVEEVRKETPYAENNKAYEEAFPQVAELTKLLNDNGYAAYYELYQVPAGNLITATIFDIKSGRNTSTLIVDPNVIYRNGYNVMTATSKDAKILTEAMVPMSDHKTILKMASKRLNQKERREIIKRYPSCLKNVYEIIDFSGIGISEPIPNGEWVDLVNALGEVIKKENLIYRTRIVDYMNPKKFKLLSNGACYPVTFHLDDAKRVRTDGASVWVAYDIDQFGEKLYESGYLPKKVVDQQNTVVTA